MKDNDNGVWCTYAAAALTGLLACPETKGDYTEIAEGAARFADALYIAGCHAPMRARADETE